LVVCIAHCSYHTCSVSYYVVLCCFFIFNSHEPNEIDTRKIVGSVRCV